jgi:hypothetical protein
MTIHYEDLPHHYPLTVQIKTNKACSLKPIQGEWMINPVLDLVSDSPMSAGEVASMVADTLKKTFVGFVPRYNTGGFNASIPDFEKIVAGLKMLGEAEFNESELPNGFYKPTWHITTSKNRETWWFERIDIYFHGVHFSIRRHFKLDIRFDSLHLRCGAPGGTVRYWDFNKRIWKDSFVVEQGIEVIRYMKHHEVVTQPRALGQFDTPKTRCNLFEVASLVNEYVADPEVLPDHFIHDAAGRVNIVAEKEHLLSFPEINRIGNVETHITKSVILGLLSEFRDVHFDSYEFSWFVAPNPDDFGSVSPVGFVLE